jgi:hypothetical protein
LRAAAQRGAAALVIAIATVLRSGATVNTNTNTPYSKPSQKGHRMFVLHQRRLRASLIAGASLAFVVLLLLLSGSIVNAGDPGAGQATQFTAADPPEAAKKWAEPMPVIPGNLPWLAENSRLVFRGSLVEAKSDWDLERKLIVTRYAFTVEQVIAGDVAEQAVTLTLLGGTIDDITLAVSGLPHFEVGGDYIIFTDLERTTYDPVTGNESGVFRVGPDGGVYTHDGLRVVAVEDGFAQTSNLALDDPDRDPAEEALVVEETPKFDGNIVAIEPARPDLRPAIAYEEFVRVVQELAG